jgi:hypothetical protein
MVRYAFQCGGFSWETKETSLPGATYAGIIERLELISIPLIAQPQPLDQWFGETCRILGKLFE